MAIILKKIGRVGTTENLLQNGNREFSIGSATTEVPDDFEIPVNTIVTELVREFIGLYPLDIDLTPGSALESYKTIGAVRVCSGVYENNLPYVDSQIKRELSYLNINKSFMGDLNQVSNSALYIAGADTIVA
ncbi:MAG: hypothetical protein CV045_07375 [Cyanobacteria bacterium M5B4]|nr:MAG: hypothetical protein CV045_07375 [Cyanobacteria bacterium M5B4]